MCPSIVRTVLLVLLPTFSLLLLGGCAAKSASKFPTPAALDALAEKPVPAEEGSWEVADVETWELAGPLPGRLEAVPLKDGTPWEAFVADQLKAHAGRTVMTEGMRCVARELGRFELAQSGRAPEDLQEFVVSACGAAVGGVRTPGQSWRSLSAEVPEGELLESARAGLAASLAEALAGSGIHEVGVWFGRAEERGLVMLAVGQRYADVEPFDLAVGANGQVRLQGQMRVPVTDVDVWINRGEFAAVRCNADPGVALPSFGFDCPVWEDDLATGRPVWVELNAQPEGRHLSRTMLSVLARTGGKEPRTYVRPAMGRTQPKGTEITIGFLSALNEVRAEAGFPPVRNANAQSAVAQRLAPHFFSALWGGHSEEIADRIGLGLMAGWQVDGTVRYGGLTSAWVGHSDDPRRLLASTISRPGGRAVLLDPSVGAIAVGTVSRPDRKLLGAVVGAYAMFDPSETVDARAARIVHAITVQRAAKGLPTGRRSTRLREFTARAVERVEKDGTRPRKAMQGLLEEAARTARLSTQGWVVEVGSLDEFEVPAELLGPVAPNYDVAVAWHKPKGEPWGRYVVILVVIGAEPA